MGQIVKSIAGRWPWTVKVFSCPRSSFLAFFYFVQQVSLTCCMIAFYLFIGGGDNVAEVAASRQQFRVVIDLQEIFTKVFNHNFWNTAGEIPPGPYCPGSVESYDKDEDDGENIEEEYLEPEPVEENNPRIIWWSPETGWDPEIRRKFETRPLRNVEGVGKKVALTFDDGPFPEWTERYIKVLEATKTKATFFMLGSQVAAHPELVKAVLESGYEIGSHSWRHANLSKVTAAQAQKDLLQTAIAIERITGEPIKYFRPPYGAFSPTLMSAVKETGVIAVNWSIDPHDWTNPGPDEIVRIIVNNIHEGSIILLHEARPGTLTALPVIITTIREMGYELVTVSELIDSYVNGLKP